MTSKHWLSSILGIMLLASAVPVMAEPEVDDQKGGQITCVHFCKFQPFDSRAMCNDPDPETFPGNGDTGKGWVTCGFFLGEPQIDPAHPNALNTLE